MNTEALNWDVADENFCLWDWNLETGTIGLSTNWLRILGIDVDEYQPSSSWFNALIHPDDLKLVLYQLESHLAGLEEQIEFSFRLKNKHNQWVNFNSKGILVLQTPEGAPGHVIWASEHKEQIYN